MSNPNDQCSMTIPLDRLPGGCMAPVITTIKESEHQDTDFPQRHFFGNEARNKRSNIIVCCWSVARRKSVTGHNRPLHLNIDYKANKLH